MPKGSTILVGRAEQLVKWSCHQLCVWVAMILLLFTLSTKLLKIQVWGGKQFSAAFKKPITTVFGL